MIMETPGPWDHCAQDDVHRAWECYKCCAQRVSGHAIEAWLQLGWHAIKHGMSFKHFAEWYASTDFALAGELGVCFGNCMDHKGPCSNSQVPTIDYQSDGTIEPPTIEPPTIEAPTAVPPTSVPSTAVPPTVGATAGATAIPTEATPDATPTYTPTGTSTQQPCNIQVSPSEIVAADIIYGSPLRDTIGGTQVFSNTERRVIYKDDIERHAYRLCAGLAEEPLVLQRAKGFYIIEEGHHKFVASRLVTKRFPQLVDQVRASLLVQYDPEPSSATLRDRGTYYFAWEDIRIEQP